MATTVSLSSFWEYFSTPSNMSVPITYRLHHMPPVQLVSQFSCDEGDTTPVASCMLHIARTNINKPSSHPHYWWSSGEKKGLFCLSTQAAYHRYRNKKDAGTRCHSTITLQQVFWCLQRWPLIKLYKLQPLSTFFNSPGPPGGRRRHPDRKGSNPSHTILSHLTGTKGAVKIPWTGWIVSVLHSSFCWTSRFTSCF